MPGPRNKCSERSYRDATVDDIECKVRECVNLSESVVNSLQEDSQYTETWAMIASDLEEILKRIKKASR